MTSTLGLLFRQPIYNSVKTVLTHIILKGKAATGPPVTTLSSEVSTLLALARPRRVSALTYFTLCTSGVRLVYYNPPPFQSRRPTYFGPSGSPSNSTPLALLHLPGLCLYYTSISCKPQGASVRVRKVPARL